MLDDRLPGIFIGADTADDDPPTDPDLPDPDLDGEPVLIPDPDFPGDPPDTAAAAGPVPDPVDVESKNGSSGVPAAASTRFISRESRTACKISSVSAHRGIVQGVPTLRLSVLVAGV